MDRLRETYKIQQKTLNKIVENLPDMRPDACRTRADDDQGDDLDGLDDPDVDVSVDLRFLDQIVLAGAPVPLDIGPGGDDDDATSRY
jgi:hypothetical protein